MSATNRSNVEKRKRGSKLSEPKSFADLERHISAIFFQHILMHLDIAAVEILSFKPDDYFRTQQSWKQEVCMFF